MKKIYILICILLCCGCRAKYEIKFSDNSINDNLSVTYSKNDEIIRSFAPDPLYALGDNQYVLNTKDNGRNMDLSYTYNFNTDDYSKAFIPNSCFSSFNFIKEDGKYYFMADGEFLCKHIANKYFDSLDIVIDTNHVVIQSNADEVKKGKYIWHINPDSEEVSLKLVVSEKIIKNNSNTYFWGVISIVGIGVLFIIKKTRNDIK